MMFTNPFLSSSWDRLSSRQNNYGTPSENHAAKVRLPRTVCDATLLSEAQWSNWTGQLKWRPLTNEGQHHNGSTEIVSGWGIGAGLSTSEWTVCVCGPASYLWRGGCLCLQSGHDGALSARWRSLIDCVDEWVRKEGNWRCDVIEWSRLWLSNYIALLCHKWSWVSSCCFSFHRLYYHVLCTAPPQSFDLDIKTFWRDDTSLEIAIKNKWITLWLLCLGGFRKVAHSRPFAKQAGGGMERCGWGGSLKHQWNAQQR